MTTGSKASARTSRAWLGVVAPLGLTCLFAVAGWLFVASVSAEQERLDSDALRLESYARLEAGELAARSRNFVKTLVDNRLAARRSQERNLQLELRGVMDAVYRLLAAGLEKAQANTAVRREVGDFPSGFSGVQNYLEIAAARSGSDQAVAALRACSPELAALLPSGCSLTVVESNFQEHLSLGGGSVPENAVSETMTREFIWDDGGRGRRWTLQVRMNAPNVHPLPDARELAAQLTGELGQTRLDRVAWRGWLVDGAGQDVAFFPQAAEAAGAGDGALPFIDMPGEWVEMVESRRLLWLERPSRIDNQDLTTAVAVAIDRPAPPLVLTDELLKDTRWSVTLGILAVLAVSCWIWFVRVLLGARRPRPSPVEAERARPAAGGRPRQRLVRDDSLSRVIPEVQGVIVADIDASGVHVEGAAGAVPAPAPVRPRLVIPSGSLHRLQNIHRGGKGMRGSRVLDQARSQVLRELADRVRPVVGGGAGAQVRGAADRAGEKIHNMKSPTGWRKVGDDPE